MRFILGLTLVFAGCVADGSPDLADAAPSADAPPVDPPLVGTQWRLASLEGDGPVEGVRPVLVFTDQAAERDMFDRPYGDAFRGWSLMTGESGVGYLHAPYRMEGDTLRVSRLSDFKTRLSTEAEERQALALLVVLEGPSRLRKDGRRLALLAGADTLATFTADPPRTPGPLDDIEWGLVSLGGEPLIDGTRGTLTFTSQPAGPGPSDGYDLLNGDGGCNGFGGGYRLNGGRLSHPPAEAGLVATDMGCEPALLQQESRFLSAVWDAVRVCREGDRLELLGADGTALAVLERRPPPLTSPR